ncbi:MAG TPA: hypothetical protein VM452_14975 [Caulifigura sp.]|nr:hypothetical protein [Caulifigura sp.]
MDGRPFRIAAAGLGTALIASIVAGVSHFRTESRLLAQSQAVSIPADSISIALSPAPDALTVPAWKADEAVANTLPDRSGRSHRPGASVASTVRRKKEFVELPPPPEFLDEPEQAAPIAAAPRHVRSLDTTTDQRLLAELTSLRREFEQATRHQRLEHELERDRHARELAAVATEHRLAELKAELDEMKASQLDRRVAMLQTEPPPPLFDRPLPPAEAPPETPAPAPFEPQPQPAPAVEASDSNSPGHFDFHFEKVHLHAALAHVGQRGAMNLVVSPEVTGEITAAWKNITPHEALEAIRLAHGLTVQPQGTFVLISNAKDEKGRSQTSKNTLVQMFRPLYISGRDLLPLIEPLLTPDIGRISVTPPQSTNESGRVGGGDSLAQPDALIVVDFPEVIEVVERTIAEIDVPAPHVELEATVLDIQLSGRVKNGVAALIASGEFSTRPGFVSLDDPRPIPCDSCCQTCDMSCADVVEKLKLWTDVKLVSNARLLVLNKQPAELSVGSESVCLLPHGGTMPTAAVDGGMRLFVRPFVSADHLVRLEVSPEAVTSRSQPMNTRRGTFASVATNVAVPNGGSLVIAGLNVDQSVAPSAIFQGLGRLRKKHKDEADRAVRREIVIMISPRVVQDCAAPQ